MVEKYGLKERSTRAHHFILPFQDDKKIRESPPLIESSGRGSLK
jgi:hypothetical protein